MTMFDCLHDMGDPVGAARHVRQTLAPDGTWMIVEPKAGDRVEDNFNPVGRAYYGFSTLLCTPASLSQEVGLALGGAGGRGADPRGRDGRRLRQLPARGGDAVQPRVRGAPVTEASIAGDCCPATGRKSPPRPGPASRRARAIPDETGYVDSRRGQALLGALRRRRPHGAAAADLVDRALARLEAADPVPRTSLPCAHLRRSRERALRPAGGRRGVRDREFAADAFAVMDATGTDGRALVALSCGALWATIMAATMPGAG